MNTTSKNNETSLLIVNARHLEKLKTKKGYWQKLKLNLGMHPEYLRATVKLILNSLNVGM